MSVLVVDLSGDRASFACRALTNAGIRFDLMSDVHATSGSLLLARWKNDWRVCVVVLPPHPEGVLEIAERIAEIGVPVVMMGGAPETITFARSFVPKADHGDAEAILRAVYAADPTVARGFVNLHGIAAELGVAIERETLPCGWPIRHVAGGAGKGAPTARWIDVHDAGTMGGASYVRSVLANSSTGEGDHLFVDVNMTEFRADAYQLAVPSAKVVEALRAYISR